MEAIMEIIEVTATVLEGICALGELIGLLGSTASLEATENEKVEIQERSIQLGYPEK